MVRHSINEKTPKDEDDKNVAVDLHINKDSTYSECVNGIVKHPSRSWAPKETTSRGALRLNCEQTSISPRLLVP